MKYRIGIPPLDLSEIRRYAGLRSSDFLPERIREAARLVQLLSEGYGTVRYYPYDSAHHTIIAEDAALPLTSKAICSHLDGAQEVAVMAVTIGEAVEDAIKEAFANGEYSLGLLLDAAATTAVESAADWLNHAIDTAAKKRGLSTTFRFSPGYGDWQITVQEDIVRLAEGEQIGIRVTDASMLIPRKSVTAVIALRDYPAEPCKQGCSVCPQKNCLSRKETTP